VQLAPLKRVVPASGPGRGRNHRGPACRSFGLTCRPHVDPQQLSSPPALPASYLKAITQLGLLAPRPQGGPAASFVYIDDHSVVLEVRERVPARPKAILVARSPRSSVVDRVVGADGCPRSSFLLQQLRQRRGVDPLDPPRPWRRELEPSLGPQSRGSESLASRPSRIPRIVCERHSSRARLSSFKPDHSELVMYTSPRTPSKQ